MAVADETQQMLEYSSQLEDKAGGADNNGTKAVTGEREADAIVYPKRCVFKPDQPRTADPYDFDPGVFRDIA